MSEQEMLINFSKNLNYFLKLNDINQIELAKAINASTSSVSNWCQALKMPRMDKIEEIAKFFGVQITDLVYDRSEKHKRSHYYHDIETRDIADAISKDSELKLLFSAARDASPEDLKTVHEMLKALKRKEQRDD